MFEQERRNTIKKLLTKLSFAKFVGHFRANEFWKCKLLLSVTVDLLKSLAY